MDYLYGSKNVYSKSLRRHEERISPYRHHSGSMHNPRQYRSGAVHRAVWGVKKFLGGY
jgi:hypothetical protein